jgi:hypothetical protein
MAKDREAVMTASAASSIETCLVGRHELGVKMIYMSGNPNDSGKTAYFAVQIENEGKKGPWGPLVSALIA